MEGKDTRQTLVVVGHGMTSHALCRRLVECGATRDALRVVVVGEEPRPAYDRVHLTDLLAGRSEADLTLAPAAWYEDNDIELHIGDPVSALDRDDCLVRTQAGVSILFDRLVLATGSRPFVPEIPGTDLPGVFVYRTVADVQAIRAHAASAARAVVVGGGLLGLEAANAVRRLGLDVHVVEASPGLLPRQLDAAGAALLRDRVEALGVHVHTGARITAVEEASHRGACAHRLVRFDDGASLSADLVIFAAGIRPRSELGRDAGLELAPNGGVAVDDRLTTSDPRIFAVGECAAHRGTTYGLAAPGYRMVDVLVNNLAGGDAVFEGASLSARLKLLGVEVAALGRHDERATPGAAVHVHLASGVYRKLVVSDGRIVGALAVGAWDDLPRVEDAIVEPRRFSFWDLRRFRGTGSLFLRSESPPVHLWPADALVCGCLCVRRGAISDAEAQGCATVEEISARTGAGTMCGSCRPLIADYLRRDRADSITPASLAALALGSDEPAPEEPPETLRCNPEGEDPAPAGSISRRPSDRPASGPPWKRPAFDTLPSSVGRRARLHDVPSDRPPVFGTEALALALAPPPSDDDLVPISISPASSIRSSSLPSSGRADLAAVSPPLPSSGPADRAAGSAPRSYETPASSRRESMIPLAPIAVPPSLLPSVPPPRGSIAPTAAQLGSDERARRALVHAGAVAIAGACLVLAVPGVRPARSFGGLSADAVVSSPALRQISGYAVLGLALLGGALSLQKRMKRPASLDLPGARAIHALLGAAAVACLALHTGLHLGSRLARLLTLDFLALSALGGAAALATALGGAAPASQAQRARLSRAHVVLFLPFPALIALHVLRAYWF